MNNLGGLLSSLPLEIKNCIYKHLDGGDLISLNEAYPLSLNELHSISFLATNGAFSKFDLHPSLLIKSFPEKASHLSHLQQVACHSKEVIVTSLNTALLSLQMLSPSKLTLSSDGLFGGDQIEFLSKLISSGLCKYLHSLNFTSNLLEDKGFIALCRALKSGATELNEIKFDESYCSFKILEHLTEVIGSGNSSLHRLKLPNFKRWNDEEEDEEEDDEDEDRELDDDDDKICRNFFDSIPKASPHFTELNMESLFINGSRAEALAIALENEKSPIEILGLRFCRISDDGAISISRALGSEHNKLSEIDVSYNKFSADGFRAILLATCSNASKSFSLSASYMDGQVFAEAIERENCKLSKFEFIVSETSHFGNFLPFAKSLEVYTNYLTDLRISECGVTDEDADALAKTLISKNCKIIRLDLSENRITHKGIKSLSKALCTREICTKEFVIIGNTIGLEGAASFAKVIYNSKYESTVVDLSCTNIRSYGVEAIAKSLRGNHRVKQVLLTGNEICYRGAEFISLALRLYSNSIMDLNLQSNKLGNEGAKAIALALSSANCRVRNLDLSHNCIGSEGISALTEAFKKRSIRMNQLNLSYNQFDSHKLGEIIDAFISSTSSVKTLDLRGNDTCSCCHQTLKTKAQNHFNSVGTLIFPSEIPTLKRSYGEYEYDSDDSY